MKVGAVNWKIRQISTERDFYDHAEELIDQAAEEHVDWLLLPEFFTFELLWLENFHSTNSVTESLRAEIIEPILEMAKSRRMSLTAGSTFSNGANVAISQSADGIVTTQAKMVLTQFEVVEWGVVPGTKLSATHDERVSVAICYDSEFPECGRAHAEAGALLLLVPAFTETEHGFWRVRHSCHARAIENQIFVAHSSLVGSLGKEPVPSAAGSAAILAPSVEPYPARGVLAETTFDEEGIAVAELDFQNLLIARTEGDVRNWNDRHRVNWTGSKM